MRVRAAMLVVVGDEHAAFAGGDGLVGVEAEAGLLGGGADRAPRAVEAARRGREGVGGVLDHAHVVDAGERGDPVDVGHLAAVVHGDDGARGARIGDAGDAARLAERVEQAGGVAGIEVERVVLAVDEARAWRRSRSTTSAVAAKVMVGTSTRSPGRTPVGFERQVQRGGARVDGDGVRGADGGGELALERLALAAGGEPARAQDGGDGGDLFVADGGTVERDAILVVGAHERTSGSAAARSPR